MDLEVGRQRIGHYQDLPARGVRSEAEIDRLKIHQECVRHHVVNAVRLTVESTGVRGREIVVGPVKNDIAAYIPYAGEHDLAGEEPEALLDH